MIKQSTVVGINLKKTIMKIKSAFFIFCILIMSYSFQSRNNPVRENEMIARAFIEAWDSHDMNKLNSLFADEFVYLEVASGRSYSTKDVLSNYVNATISGIPDSRFEVISVLANEQLAAVEWIWKGTNTVGWEQMGIPATNKYFELSGVSVMEIENQKIKRNSDYWDWNSLMRLIGPDAK